MTVWYQLVLLEFKTQFFPKMLLNEMMEKYGKEKEAYKIEKLKEVPEIFLDYGGMCQEGMVDMEFELPGCILKIPARDVELFFRQLNSVEPRNDFSVLYYKYISHWTCIILLPSQRDILLPLVADKLQEACEIAEKEWADLRKATEDINKKAGRIAVIPPSRALREEDIN